MLMIVFLKCVYGEIENGSIDDLMCCFYCSKIWFYLYFLICLDVEL